MGNENKGGGPTLCLDKECAYGVCLQTDSSSPYFMKCCRMMTMYVGVRAAQPIGSEVVSLTFIQSFISTVAVLVASSNLLGESPMVMLCAVRWRCWLCFTCLLDVTGL